MQYLRVIAIPSPDGQFDVYWSNTNLETVRGIAHVTVPPGDDRNIIAELHALQYLLEVEEAVGENAAGGPAIKLVVSVGQIKLLSRGASSKQALVKHAKFLTTRFKGCKIEVKKDAGWVAVVPANAKHTELDAGTPFEEVIALHGLGDVTVTTHVVEQFAEHLAHRRGVAFAIAEAWRLLRDLASDGKITEVARSNEKKRLGYALKGMQEGRYFVHPNKKWILVCTKRESQNRMALVTVYPMPEEDA